MLVSIETISPKRLCLSSRRMKSTNICAWCTIFISAFSFGLVKAEPLNHQDFFADAQISSALLSPKGQSIVYAKEMQGDFELYLKLGDKQTFERIFSYRQLFDKNAYLADMAWVDDRYIAVSVIKEILPVAELNDTKYKRKQLFIDTLNLPDTRHDLLSIKTKGRMINTMPDVPGKVLYARSASVSRAYEIELSKLKKYGSKRKKTERLDGGQFSKDYVVSELDGYVYRWFSHGRKLVGALTLDKKKRLTLQETIDDGKTWTEIEHFDSAGNGKKSKEDYSLPIDYAGEPGTYYVSKTDENGSDTLSLQNYSTGSKTMLYQTGDAKISRIQTAYADKALRSIVLTARGEPIYIYYKGQGSEHIAAAREANIEGYLAIASSDLQGKKVILYNFGVDNPGSFLEIDARGKPKIVQHALPRLADSVDSRINVDQVKVDDLEIEYFLTLPRTTDQASPLVVVPHGGPIGVMDTRLYDPVTQYLVHRGFAVLQVNYRGSVGYGKHFIDAGKKQFGSGILRDIYTATQKVMKRKDINEGKICIMGSSYGGYAALAMPLKYPKLFKCAAAFAAVTDLQLWAAPVFARKSTLDWLHEYVGNPETEADSLREESPVYSASQYDIPLMIAHGEDDSTVDVEHYFRMTHALEAANIPHKRQLLPDVEHGFSDSQQRALFYKGVTDFIAESLKML